MSQNRRAILALLANGLVGALFVLGLLVDGLASVCLLLLFILSVSVFRKETSSAGLSSAQKAVICSFALYFLIGVFTWLVGERTELGFKILGRDIRFMFAIPVFYLIVSAGLYKETIRYSFVLSGLLLGLSALFVVVIEGSEQRFSGASISILLGHLAAAVVAVNFAFVLSSYRSLKLLHAIAALCAMLAVWFSGTRGAMFSVLVVVLILPIVMNKAISFKATGASLAAGVLIVLLFTTTSPNRYADGMVELQRSAKYMRMISRISEESRLPACISDGQILEWIIDNSRTAGEGRLIVKVERADRNWVDDSGACTSGDIIVIENTSSSAHGWIFMPNRNVPAHESLSGAVMVQGEGVAGLASWKESERKPISSRNPEMVTFTKSHSSDNRMLFVLYPGQKLKVVPLLTYPFEYHFVVAGDSLTSRLVMWQVAAQAGSIAPITGVGPGGYRELAAQTARMGVIPYDLARYDHPHSEFMTMFAERGVLGVISLVALYLTPLFLFGFGSQPSGLAGSAFVISIAASGLSETIFNHSLGITFYAVAIAAFACQVNYWPTRT